MNLFKKMSYLLLLLTSILIGQQSEEVRAEFVANKEEVASFIDGKMEKDLKEFNIPGAVISVVKNEEIIYSKGYGMADISKNKKVSAEDSMFRIASTTKLFTWTAVMQLVEKGKIDLDADINTYLTSIQIPDTFKEPITMRHLMTHTAGFEEGGVGYQITTDKKRLNTTIANNLEKHPLARVRPVGEKPSYSNYGASLAGLIIEDVSGLTYDEYVQKNIFDRLEMKNATVTEPLPKKYKSNEVIGYNYEANKFIPGTPTYEGGFSPAGAGTVSANDMSKFMMAHLNKGSIKGSQLLEPSTTELMHKTAFRFDKRLPGSALGFQEGEINGQQVISHAGADTMFITDMYLIPKENVGIFLSYSGGQADDALASMKISFFNHYFPNTKKEKVTFIKTEKKELDAYTGTYKFSRRNFSHIDKFFSLLAEMKIAQVDGQLSLGKGKEQERFKKIDTNLFQQINGQHQLAFKTDESGKVTDMLLSIMPDMPLEKTKFWDKSLVWLSLLGISIIIYFITIICIILNSKKIKKLNKKSKQVMFLLLTTSVSAVLTLILTVTNVLNMDVLQRLSEVTLSLKLFLILPILVSVLTIFLGIKVGSVWYKKDFTLLTRVLMTIVLLAAMAVTAFFLYWNLLGWNFG